jgi:hypothetical protein
LFSTLTTIDLNNDGTTSSNARRFTAISSAIPDGFTLDRRG